MKTNSATAHGSLLLAHVLALAGLACLCGRFTSLPQLANGSDVLSVIFGDAREVISRAAVQKADSYFHGGIDMDTHEDEGGCEDFCGHHEKTENSTTAHCSLLTAHSLPDPWHWIDSRIRVPHEHKHLEGAKAVELMPWLWAAVRTDPHNAEAWSVAWYAASHIMKDKEMAARVLAEAKAKNPESIEIAFTEGRALYDGGKGDLVAAKLAFKRTVELAEAKLKTDSAALSPREDEAYRFAGNYLKTLDKKP